ncbi:carboxypeptidase regulatory-like domain-containing protein [Granulicella sp. L60]|uniref:carboxypeptidase regulatory-like domain-containing protein n=1 Tax=Granulicella sp. L60 TaxID=1641866 RepID=UPI00131B0C5F|nr:carboxypeptidase regulatory-like domain-containing protein [Granulicella sp. L60]
MNIAVKRGISSFPGLLLTVFIASLLFTRPVLAQFASGIEATVVDKTGAVIPGAQFTITNQNTQITEKATADGQGYVHILQLPPGVYRAKIERNGFTSWEQKDIRIEGHDVRTLYPKLDVGQQSMTVEVTADHETVQTTSGNIGRTLETQTVQESPLVGQDVLASVATLAPGVTGLGGAAGNIGSAGSVGTSSFTAEAGYQINAGGQRQEANEYQVDGTTVNGNSRDGITNITPEPETIQEMKVTAASFDASKGLQSGALIEIFTKSGTNQFHGMLSEFHTDNALTARTEFQTSVPKYIRNDFGGTIGGPIYKNKTFFFGSLFWSRSLLGQTVFANVETPEFENYVKTNFPNSIAAQFFAAGPPGAVPTSNFLTVAQVESQYASVYTPPSIPASLVAVGTARVNSSPISNGFQGHVRLDHNLRGDNDKLFFSFFRNTTQGEVADPRPNYSYISPNATLYAKFDYVHAFSSSLVNEAGISYTRNTGNQPIGAPSLPNVYYIGSLSDDFSEYGPISWAQNNWEYQDSLSYTRGAHNVHVGVDIERQQDLDNFTDGLVRPYFYFLNVVDFAADQPFYQSGPVVDLTTQTTANNLYQRVMMIYVAPYVQDNWKVKPRLSLNFGMRLDDYGHLATVENGHTPIAFFTAGSGSSLAEQIANGSMQVRHGNGSATTGTQFRFAPRVGFAWDVFGNGKTSVHGGYSLFSNKVGEYAYVNNMRTNPPGVADPTIDIFNAGTTTGNFSYGTSGSGATGFAPPHGITYQVDQRGGLVGTRTSVGGLDPNLAPPLVHSWALGVQHAIGGFVIEANYMGSASRDLYLQTDVNRFAGDYVINNGFSNRLNPSFSTVTYGRSVGIGNGELGTIGISRHWSKNWTMHVTYTLSKSLDYTSSNDNGVGGAESIFDAQHPERQYARSDYDARHRLSADAYWYISGPHSGIAHAILGGWSVAPVIILQSGTPFTVYTSAPYASGGDYNADGFDFDVPNVPKFGRHISTNRSDFLKGLFKPSDFPVPAAGQEGDLGRNTYDTPGYANVSLAIQRVFPVKILGPAGKFEMRGELLNAFNRVNLGYPVNDLSNASFGTSTTQYPPRQIQLQGHLRF